MVIKQQETNDFARETKVTVITPILDTIQVNGDQVSFRGKSGKQIYQVYYKVPTEQEQQYFMTLSQSVVLSVSSQL